MTILLIVYQGLSINFNLPVSYFFMFPSSIQLQDSVAISQNSCSPCDFTYLFYYAAHWDLYKYKVLLLCTAWKQER